MELRGPLGGGNLRKHSCGTGMGLVNKTFDAAGIDVLLLLLLLCTSVYLDALDAATIWSLDWLGARRRFAPG